MKHVLNCAVIIPCFNEAETMASVVAGARRHVAVVIVVDDGSTDETAMIAAKSGAVVVRHNERRGKGAALKTGLRSASGRGFKWAITMDGDGQHSTDDIPDFFDCAEGGGAALVVGNRMDEAERMPWLRRWVNRGMSAALSRIARQRLPDSQCGFRLLNLDVWSSLQTDSRHFEFESELLLAFARANHRIHFVPVQVIYRNERSKICPLRDTIRWFLWLGRAWRAA